MFQKENQLHFQMVNTRNQQEAYKRGNQIRINIIRTMEKLRYKKDFQENKKSYTVIYGNQEIGTYIGSKNSTPPQQFLLNFKNKTNNIRHLEVTDIPIHTDAVNQESKRTPLKTM